MAERGARVGGAVGARSSADTHRNGPLDDTAELGHVVRDHRLVGVLR